jgi:hypothetical protein
MKKPGAVPSIANGLFCAVTNEGSANKMINKRFMSLNFLNGKDGSFFLLGDTITC